MSVVKSSSLMPMSKALLDLPDTAKALFPSHGWIESQKGIRQLRFPLLRVFQMNHPAYAKYQALGLAGMWLQTRSPYRTLRQLCIALRELHSELRFLLESAEEEWFQRDASRARDLAMTREGESRERCEVLLLSIFVLLRRLADDVMGSVRPVLFEHWRSAPSELKKAEALAEAGRIHSLKPYCDPELLTAELIANSVWLQRLRKEGGIRDTLIHWPHLLKVGPYGTKPPDTESYSWHISASLQVQASEGLRIVELFPVLLECLAGACKFMASICRLIGGMDNYDRGDYMFLTGNDNDIVGFWPAIAGGQHAFPFRE